MSKKLQLAISFQKNGKKPLTLSDKKQAADIALWNIEALTFFIASLNPSALEQLSEQIDEDSPENYLKTAKNLINEFLGVARINLVELDDQRVELESKLK